MNSVTRSITFFTCGAIVASLPWLLGSRATVAQDAQGRPPGAAGPAVQGFQVAPDRVGGPGQGGGFGQPGQFRPQGAPVSTIAFHGDFMFVGAGDMVYKIDHKTRGNEPMRIV
ncbi:MAG TPA: hypothetical protein VK171_05895, partial [Fimbriimonas sp.]|nr:hypothetical protein [Fimbriimonas sp.]